MAASTPNRCGRFAWPLGRSRGAPTSEAEDALRLAFVNPLPRTTLRGRDGAVRSAAFDRSGKRVIASHDNGTTQSGSPQRPRLQRCGATRAPSRARPAAPTSSSSSRPATTAVRGSGTPQLDLFVPSQRSPRAGLPGGVESARRPHRRSELRRDRAELGYRQRPPIRVLDAKDGPVFGAAFRPDGKLVATANGHEGGVYLWRLGRAVSDSGSRPRTGACGNVEDVAFSSDGALIATAASDGSARLWDARNGRLRQTLTGHEGSVFSAAFSPDRSRVVTAGSDGSPGYGTRRRSP